MGVGRRIAAGSRRGSELVEGMLMLLPFLALVFIIIDASYGIFLNSTLQYAVQAGVNYAALDTAHPLMAGIQSTVETSIQPTTLTVNFFAPASMTVPLPQVGGPVPNQAGNVVQVSATYVFAPLAPLFRSANTITLTATAASVLAANPPPSL